MKIYKEEQLTIPVYAGYKTFNDTNENAEAIRVSVIESKVTHVPGTYEADLTPEQIEEIKRSMKNDHLQFA